MSISKDIAVELSSRLASIKKANGYSTDCGTRVFRGRKRLDETLIPCIVVIEGDDKVTDRMRDKVKINQRYMIEAHLPCDPDNPNDDAHDAISDLKKCIFGSTDNTFGNVVRDLQYVSRVISAREDGMAIVAGGIEIEVSFAEEVSNP